MIVIILLHCIFYIISLTNIGYLLIMAHTKSAKKRIRQNNKKAIINSARRTKVRTYIKKVESAISKQNKAEAQEAFKLAQPILHASINKGVFHKNTIARKLSRLSARIKAIV